MKAKFVAALGIAAMVVAAACSSPPEEVAPQPDPDSIAREQARRDSIARAQALQDSIRRAQAEQERIRREAEEAARREAAAVTARVRDMLAGMIHFDFDKSDVRAGQDESVLQQKLRILQANSALRLEITGHCDERGSDEYNMALGMRRANAAKQWLVDHGITESRLTVRSMGEERPMAMGSTEDAWEQNRRDEFAITAGGDRLVMPSGM